MGNKLSHHVGVQLLTTTTITGNRALVAVNRTTTTTTIQIGVGVFGVID
jgi:hypothetical protein